jgi:hypothetical protein
MDEGPQTGQESGHFGMPCGRDVGDDPDAVTSAVLIGLGFPAFAVDRDQGVVTAACPGGQRDPLEVRFDPFEASTQEEQGTRKEEGFHAAGEGQIAADHFGVLDGRHQDTLSVSEAAVQLEDEELPLADGVEQRLGLARGEDGGAAVCPGPLEQVVEIGRQRRREGNIPKNGVDGRKLRGPQKDALEVVVEGGRRSHRGVDDFIGNRVHISPGDSCTQRFREALVEHSGAGGPIHQPSHEQPPGGQAGTGAQAGTGVEHAFAAPACLHQIVGRLGRIEELIHGAKLSIGQDPAHRQSGRGAAPGPEAPEPFLFVPLAVAPSLR